MADWSFEVLKRQAVELGLTGDCVEDYIKEKQAIFREERAKEREIEKYRYEVEKAKLDLEREKVKANRDIELAKLNGQGAIALSTNCDGVKRPSLPMYKEGEDMANYLLRFERIAGLLNVDKSSYAVRLGSLLTDKAAEIYISLSPDITSDYTLLKSALLKGFSKTASSYRSDFRSAKLKYGETFQQFTIQLDNLFDLWIGSCEVTEDYESLRSFMILDQFISALSPELRMFIKEHNVTKLDEAVSLADNWSSAHGSYPKRNPDKGKDVKDGTPKYPVTREPEKSKVKRDYSKAICHFCNEPGHIKPNCPNNPANY